MAAPIRHNTCLARYEIHAHPQACTLLSGALVRRGGRLPHDLSFLLGGSLKAVGFGDGSISRGASNDMPNRRYLAWRLISASATAKLFSFGTSNLPPSKEGGQGDCDGANQMELHEQNVVALRRLLRRTSRAGRSRNRASSLSILILWFRIRHRRTKYLAPRLP